MPGILGIPAIPTTAELTAMGIALEDHAATQATAIIDHAKQELLLPLLEAVDTINLTAHTVPAQLLETLSKVLYGLNGTALPIKANGVTIAEATLSIPQPGGNTQ